MAASRLPAPIDAHAPAETAIDARADARIDPRYSHRFACIGPACEDTCCQGWNIRVDQATYGKYQSLPEGALRQRMGQNLVLITEDRTPARHAEIRLDANGVCAFLDPDRLCSIQKERGADYLSRTCAQYPRSVQQVDGGREEVLLLSCPEAARLVLLDPQLMPEVTAQSYQDFRKSLPGPLSPSWPSARKASRAAKHAHPGFRPIRRLALLLLGDRSYALWQRILLAGLLCMRLEAGAGKDQPEATAHLLCEYAAFAADGSLRAAMNRIPARPVLQLTAVMNLLRERLCVARPAPRLLACLHRFLEGIGYRDGASLESLAPAYLRAFRDHYLPWRERHPLVLENFLLNTALATLFPFGETVSPPGFEPRREALRLAVHYGLIQGLLIGMAAGCPGGLAIGDALQLIQSYMKVFDHNPSYIGRVIAMLQAEGLDNARGIAALVRDPVE